jgi:hypothetical protein
MPIANQSWRPLSWICVARVTYQLGVSAVKSEYKQTELEVIGLIRRLVFIALVSSQIKLSTLVSCRLALILFESGHEEATGMR